MPVDQLAMHLLWRFADAGQAKAFRRVQFINEQAIEAQLAEHRGGGQRAVHSAPSVSARPELALALAEAWAWLVSHDLLGQDPLPRGSSQQVHPDAYFVTRRGFDVAAAGTDGLGLVRAQRRLGVELHPQLEGRLRPLVSVGAFEQAALDALRHVEVLVSRLAGHPTDQSGAALTTAKLMRHALSPQNGPLTDPQADPGEKVGVMELFAGAFGAVRNPLSHRQVQWTDPTEAAEFVLLADLLVRQLDRIASRLGQTL